MVKTSSADSRTMPTVNRGTEFSAADTAQLSEYISVTKDPAWNEGVSTDADYTTTTAAPMPTPCAAIALPGAKSTLCLGRINLPRVRATRCMIGKTDSPSTTVLVAKRLIQRVSSSNPLTRNLKTMAEAFKNEHVQLDSQRGTHSSMRMCQTSSTRGLKWSGPIAMFEEAPIDHFDDQQKLTRGDDPGIPGSAGRCGSCPEDAG